MKQPAAANRFGKDLATGSYDLIVLDVLRDEPAYGYEIIQRIFAQSRQTIRWHGGTVYRVLRDLARRGLVTGDWRGRQGQRRRHYYRLTPHGQRAWRDQREQWRQFSQAVNALLGLSVADERSSVSVTPLSARVPRG